MKRTDTIIIGGGQAGLAMSRCLAAVGIEHVVLERGRIGERWRSERWDSLRLLTPNWRSRLPGWQYDGPSPDGYMTVGQFVDYLEGYAQSFVAPIRAETTVLSVEPLAGGYRVVTNRGSWQAPNVVVATGHCDKPFVPGMSRNIADRVHQLVPTRYRNPGELPSGGVLVVGASASGLQLADEIQQSGRPVTLAVGRHVRLPRQYRGRDIMWWLDRMGVLDATNEEVFDLEQSRRSPSLQLVGGLDKRTLDLSSVQASGVRLAGRAIAAADDEVIFADDLGPTVAAADDKLSRLLERIDHFIDEHDLGGFAGERERILPIEVDRGPKHVKFAAEGIKTVIWATGFRRTYPWLKVPVLDSRGEIVHIGGVTRAPGLYALGLQHQRRRSSSFIDGVGRDAEELAQHISNRMAVSQHLTA